jgi:hypothetical protein
MLLPRYHIDARVGAQRRGTAAGETSPATTLAGLQALLLILPSGHGHRRDNATSGLRHFFRLF